MKEIGETVPSWMLQQVEDHARGAEQLRAVLPDVVRVAVGLRAALAAGGCIYTFGNGGSAADAQHFTGELIGHYRRDRRPLPAVTLSTDPTVMTCIANDYAFSDIFARQIEALAKPADVVIGFSTSGTSANVVAAIEAARRIGATTVLFTGGSGGADCGLADHLLVAPSSETARIQEMHTLMLHILSEYLDTWAAGQDL